MDLAEANNVHLIFNHKLTNIIWDENKITFENSHERETIYFNLLFGSDGSYSATRLAHMLNHSRFEYNQTYIDCGYKELSIPPTASGDFQLEKNALHIWHANSTC
jgi:kynurenine 3-monooxygenase